MGKPKLRDATWEELEKEIKLLNLLLKRLSEGDLVAAGVRLSTEIALQCGCSPAESLGILEGAKLEIFKIFMSQYCKNCEDCDKDQDDAPPQ